MVRLMFLLVFVICWVLRMEVGLYGLLKRGGCLLNRLINIEKTNSETRVLFFEWLGN